MWHPSCYCETTRISFDKEVILDNSIRKYI